jgi:hypothetical protein
MILGARGALSYGLAQEPVDTLLTSALSQEWTIREP